MKKNVQTVHCVLVGSTYYLWFARTFMLYVNGTASDLCACAFLPGALAHHKWGARKWLINDANSNLIMQCKCFYLAKIGICMYCTAANDKLNGKSFNYVISLLLCVTCGQFVQVIRDTKLYFAYWFLLVDRISMTLRTNLKMGMEQRPK